MKKTLTNLIKKVKLINWSLRKLQLPIKRTDLVLEVGSGGNPHPASDVLLEKFVDSSHRLRPIKIDRYIVLADACKMPFKNNAFDYSIAFHVLEHIPEPDLFLNELARISKAGYIETPNFLYERIKPLNVHLLEIGLQEEKLLIRKKSSAIDDQFINDIDLLKNEKWSILFNSNPKLFHICHHWSNKISYEIYNADENSAWHLFPDPGLSSNTLITDNEVSSSTLRELLISLTRYWYTFRKAKTIDLDRILACPECHADLTLEKDIYCCKKCGSLYNSKPIPDFTLKIK